MIQESLAPSLLVPPAPAATAASYRRPAFAGAFGQRFFIALLVGFVWLGPAWLDLRFLWGLLAWDLLMLLVWLEDWRRLPSPGGIEVERCWGGPLSQGTETEVALEARQEAGAALTLTLIDDPPVALGFSSRSRPPQFNLQLPARGSAAAVYTLRPEERGDAEMGRVFLRYRSPLQFAERWAVADLRQKVRVYPNLQEWKRHAFYLMRSRQIELDKRLKRQHGFGREFESLREYVNGDEPRDICWTATARRGRLITKTYQAERSQSVQLVLDAGRLMLARTEPNADAGLSPSGAHHALRVEPGPASAKSKIGPTKLDCAVAAAMGLAQVALYCGDAVGLLAYGRTFSSLQAAVRGKRTSRALLERLAAVRGELLEADHARAADTLLGREKRRSLVVWLTDVAETAATPEVIESAVRLSRRHLLLLVVIGQPQLARVASRRPETAREMYLYVAAQQMMARRELLLRRVRAEGALAVELEPGALASGLVTQYLEVKERSLL